MFEPCGFHHGAPGYADAGPAHGHDTDRGDELLRRPLLFHALRAYERGTVQDMFKWLGVDFAQSKIKSGTRVPIRVILYDFESGTLAITPDRREALLFELAMNLERGELSSSAASKPSGKLALVASQDRHGRTFLRALSERQYSSHNRSDLTGAVPLYIGLAAYHLRRCRSATIVRGDLQSPSRCHPYI